MIKNLFLLILVLFGLGQVQAQTPSNISIPENGRIVATAGQARMCNDAGTISFGNFTGQSNDFGLDTIFLCFGDTLPIIHNGDFDLTGDPNPATTPGIGYAFYDCAPTVMGDDLATIVADPCINQTSPIVIPPTNAELDQDFGIWVAAENPNGDINFFNNGFLQYAYNNGNPAPIQFWFAPITLDDFANLGFENDGMGGPAGPCVNVNTDAAFSVVYLNAITVSNQTVNNSPNGCIGSFLVEGGLPELIATSAYDIDISLDSDPDIKGEFTNSANHGDVIEFYVPQPGVYNITIEDGKSCGAAFSMDLSACETVTFIFPLENVPPGQNVCMDISVENFTNVGSMQYTVTWDPTILQYTGVTGFNTNMPDLTGGSFAMTSPGILNVSWADLSFMGVTLPDGDVIYQICFDVVGQLGDCSPIDMTGDPTPIEVGAPTDPEPEPYGVIVQGGKVIVSNDLLFVLVEADSLSCPDAGDGSFTVTLADGTFPYQFTWNTVPPSGPASAPVVIGADGGSATVGDLLAGQYQVTIEDSSNPVNMVIDTVEVLAGPELGVDLIPISPTCNGESDGRVEAQILLSGVIQTNPDPEQFTILWNTGARDVIALDSVPTGFYSVTITDNSGCTAIASTTLSQPAPLTILATNTFIQDASCSGSMDGSISITASGGTTASGSYLFQWDSGLGDVLATSAQVSDLDPGEYCVTVTDDNDCLYTDCFTVGATKVLAITQAVTDASCNGVCDGEILVTGSTTGAPEDLPYTFTWSSNATPPVNTNNSSNLTDLCAGTYIVTMTDSDPAGCEIIDTVVVVEPLPLEISLVEQNNETCIVGSDGSATVAVVGGTLPYVYDWSHDDQLNDSIATNLSAGLYTLNVTDANNCLDSLEISILAPTPPNITSLENDAVSCTNDTDGSLTVVADPTSAPITGFLWSNGSDQTTISNLGPGTYFVSVTAENGCVAIDSALVTAPPPLNLDSIGLRVPECPGDGNGQITVFVSGGTPPYRYIWSTNPTDTTTINPLPALFAGSYTVTVIDANNCEPLLVAVDLPDPPSIVVDITNLIDVTCPDDVTCNGGATATAIYSDGGTGTFNFTWSSGEEELGVASTSATQLCRGMQSVTVSDGECGVIVEFEIGSPENITVMPMTQNVSCFGLDDGSISIAVTGGTAPYDVQWPQLNTSGLVLTDLVADTYDAIITDNNGCTIQYAVEVSQPDELMVGVDPALTTPTVTCAGDTDGIIAIVSTGGNGLGSNAFLWSNGVASPSSAIANNLAPDTYFVTVTDIKGCQDSLVYTVSEPTPIVGTILPPDSPLCFGEPTDIFIDTIYGGTGSNFLTDYTYIVDNNGLEFPPNIPVNVFGGPHTITFLDSNKCELELAIEITQPQQITIDLPTEVVIELGDTLTQLTPFVAGGTQPYLSFTWTPADYLSSDTVLAPLVNPLGDIDYTFQVVDANGCTEEASVFVELDANRNVYIPNVFSPNGDGFNDEFRIFTCTGVTGINFARMYDRWGGLVYSNDDVAPGCEGVLLWDGRIDSQMVNPGVYVYIIEVEFLDGVTLLYRGDVTVLR